MCGLDNRMLMAEKKAAAEDLGFVGEITSVNTAVINDAVEKGYIPVISTIAGGYHGETYNVNADVAAASIAAKLGAMKLILMTDVKGLLLEIAHQMVKKVGLEGAEKRYIWQLSGGQRQRGAHAEEGRHHQRGNDS